MPIEMRTVNVVANNIKREIMNYMVQEVEINLDSQTNDSKFNIYLTHTANKMETLICYVGSRKQAEWFSYFMKECFIEKKLKYQEFVVDWFCGSCQLSDDCGCENSIIAANHEVTIDFSNSSSITDEYWFSKGSKNTKISKISKLLKFQDEFKEFEKMLSDSDRFNGKFYLRGSTLTMKNVFNKLNNMLGDEYGVYISSKIWDCNNCLRREEFCRCDECLY